MVDANTLTISWTRAQADRQRTLFRWLLGTALVLEGLFALAMLLFPAWTGALAMRSSPDASIWIRISGAMLLVITALQIPGWFNPLYRRWPNVVGIPWRGVLAIVCAILGGHFWIAAIVELGFAIALAAAFWYMLRAELMTRP